MLKKTVTYTDYNGVQQTEECYFNLDASEVIDLQFSEPEGYGEKMQRILEEGDGKQMAAEFRRLIEISYGNKSVDGRRFIKSPEIFEDFRRSGAYNALFMELAFNGETAADFFNGLIPPELAGKVAEALAESEKPVEDVQLPEEQDNRPLWKKENRYATDVEMRTMSEPEAYEAYVAKAKRIFD